jgi:glycosyltransferase involved in cell wall biosynthesis
MKASLITTERNEVNDIATFIESAMSQSLRPDEIIIADGGSTDGTLDVIQKYIKEGAPIKLINAPGNRSIGRNAASKAARNAVIACTDVGSRLDKDWLKNITQPFQDDPKAMVVSGNFKADPQTYFERVSATLMLNSNDKIDLATWLPSSRSIAYKKAAWEKVGGYPEHTNFNEDTPFDLALRAEGYKFEDGLKAIVYWRPRPDIKEFYKQYYYYAVGDGIDLLSPRFFTKVFVMYMGGLVLLIGGFLYWWVFGAAILILALLYLLRRVWKPWRKLGGAKTLLLMLLLGVTYDYSQMRGYLHGYLNRGKLRGSQKLVR